MLGRSVPDGNGATVDTLTGKAGRDALNRDSAGPTADSSTPPSPDSSTPPGPDSSTPPGPDSSTPPGPAIRLLPLGDSITAGVVNHGDEFSRILKRLDEEAAPVDEAVEYLLARDGYRPHLRTALANMGVTVAFEGRIVPTGARDKKARHEGHAGALTVDFLNPWADNPIWQQRPARLLLQDAMAGTSAAVLDGLPLPTGPPPLVILLMIGTNDMVWIKEGVPGALENLRRIVTKLNERYDNQACIALASIPPLHCSNKSPPPLFCEPKRKANWAAYNVGVRAIANEHSTDRIHYVPVAEGLPSSGGQYALELPGNYGDILHPNDEGYAAMAAVWADVVGKIGKRVLSGTSNPCKGPLH